VAGTNGMGAVYSCAKYKTRIKLKIHERSNTTLKNEANYLQMTQRIYGATCLDS